MRNSGYHEFSPYFNRYTEDAVDLCDILSSFAPHTKASLNELSKIMGMPGKPEGIDGTDVERYFLEGRIKLKSPSF